MKGILMMLGVGWLAVSAAPVSNAVAGELESGGDFTFEDVFSTRQQTEVFSLHGYAAFQYFDSQGTPPGGNQSFDQHIFEPFFG